MPSRNEHFNNQITMLGVTQQVHPNRDQTFIQTLADNYWTNKVQPAGQTISEQGAKDLVGEALHHRAMDEIPGIGDVRKSFDPQKQVRVTDDLPSGVLGHLNTDMLGRQKLFLKYTTVDPLRTGVVTHETAHLLTHPALEGMQWNNFNQANAIGHSWAMARAHIHIVRQTLGNTAANELRSMYRAHGVSFGRTNI